jgi:pimeloyl-ACP methyl ester carboxylesterase
MKTKYLQLDSIKMAYREFGSGPNLILLHGNSQNKGIFKKHQLHYFKNFHTYAVDSRGHGQSISLDNKFSIKQYSEDIVNFCRQMGIIKTSVMGFSDGGNICLFLAQSNPEIFEKIIALSPNYLVNGTTDETLFFLNKMYKIILFMNKMHLLPKRIVLRWELMLKDIGITSEELAKLNANILILYAEKDMIKEEHILKMSELIKNCRIKKIKETTHLNIYKNRETIKEIIEFIGL